MPQTKTSSTNGQGDFIPGDDYTEDLSVSAPVADTPPWGRITSVRADEIPGTQKRSNQWDLLFAEVMLRLEKTPRSEALQIPFASVAERDKAAHGLKERITRAYAPGGKTDDVSRWVEVMARKNKAGEGWLYIRRGEEWRSLD